jgi:hypothetical protein
MVLVRLIGAPKDAAEHPVEHGDGGVREDRFHFSRENHKGGQAARRVEPREMLSAENGRFTGNRRVARPVNALFAILSDPQFSNGLKAFDNLDQVLLGRRFRPLAQPCERRPVQVTADCKQRLQSRNAFLFQPLDKALVRAFSGASARRQANFFQGDRCRKHDASFAQMIDDRSNNGIAAIRAGRLFKRSLGGGAIILASKRANPQVSLEFAQMRPARL